MRLHLSHALALLSTLAGCAGVRQTTIRVEGGYTLRVEPVTQAVLAGEVAVHEETTDEATSAPDATTQEEPEARVYQLADIEEVRHPGLPYLIVGGLLTAAAAGGGIWALRSLRSCPDESCDIGPFALGFMSFLVLPAASFMLMRGAQLRYRSRNAFTGNSALARVRRRHVVGGTTLIGVGAAVLTTLIVWGATRSPDATAHSPERQMDSASVLAYVGAATGALAITMGGIFLVQGLRLDGGAGVSLAPLPGGGIGTLQLAF